MSIGTTIKKMRREREITQEQLAEYLGISASAVSQWECDKSCPDVTQLPILANIFNVTTDEILSVDIQNNEARIKEIFDKAWEKNNGGDAAGSEDLLRQGLRTFPNSHKLMGQLASMLYCKAFRCGSDKQKCLSASLEFAEKVIAECGDIEVKAEAIRTAADVYAATGRPEEAEKCAKFLPQLTRNDLLVYIYKGEKLAKLYKNDMIQPQITHGLLCASELCDLCGDDGRALYTDDEKLKIYRKITAIYKIIYEDDDLDFFSQFPVYANQAMAKLLAKRGDAEGVLSCLEEGEKYAVMFETYDWEHIKTSLLFRGLCDGGWVKLEPDEKSNVITQFYESLSDGEYDFVRADERFSAIETRLKDVIDG